MEVARSFALILLLNLASVWVSSSHQTPDVSLETSPSRPKRHHQQHHPVKADADAPSDALAQGPPLSHHQTLRELEDGNALGGPAEEGFPNTGGVLSLLEEKKRLLRRIEVLEEDNRKLQQEDKRRRRLERSTHRKSRQMVADTLNPSNGTGYPVSRPADCADHLVLGARESGIYEIYPFTCVCSKPVRVYCDMETDGGGWTVFLARSSEGHLQNFNKSWSEYKSGFGDADGEFWMGNEHLHAMTFSRSYALRLDVELASGDVKFSVWNDFSVDTELNRYKLVLGQYDAESTTHANCFNNNNGRFFTTYDRDYDGTTGNCALNNGGFWHYLCSNNIHPTSLHTNGIVSTCFNQNRDVATYLQLKMRPGVCGSTFKTIYLNSYDCNFCH